MSFGHEKLDVYRVSIDYVAWAYRLAKRLKGIDRHARDQLLRASQSIPQNIAEGNGKGTKADRRRFFEIARGSALECAAVHDTLVACEVIDESESSKGKEMLVRIVSMLTRLCGTENGVREISLQWGEDGGDGKAEGDDDPGNG